MICSSSPLLSDTMSLYSLRTSGSSSVVSSCEKPTMALSGVRISWLMLARNAVLSLLDSSARSLAAISSCSVCLSAVMS